MATPVERNELGEIENGTYTAYNSAQRLQRDVFAEIAARLGCSGFRRFEGSRICRPPL